MLTRGGVSISQQPVRQIKIQGSGLRIRRDYEVFVKREKRVPHIDAEIAGYRLDACHFAKPLAAAQHGPAYYVRVVISLLLPFRPDIPSSQFLCIRQVQDIIEMHYGLGGAPGLDVLNKERNRKSIEFDEPVP